MLLAMHKDLLHLRFVNNALLVVFVCYFPQSALLCLVWLIARLYVKTIQCLRVVGCQKAKRKP